MNKHKYQVIVYLYPPAAYWSFHLKSYRWKLIAHVAAWLYEQNNPGTITVVRKL